MSSKRKAENRDSDYEDTYEQPVRVARVDPATSSDDQDGAGSDDPTSVNSLSCPACDGILTQLNDFVQHPPAESASLFTGKSSLKATNDVILYNCFDNDGKYLFHGKCLRRIFKASGDRLSRLHKLAKARAVAPTEEMPIEQVAVDRQHDIIIGDSFRPYEFREWLSTLEPGTLVKVRQQTKTHKLQGRRSNRAKKETTRDSFRAFLRKNVVGVIPLDGELDPRTQYYLDLKFMYWASRDAPTSYDSTVHGDLATRCVLEVFNHEQEGEETVAASTMMQWVKKYDSNIHLNLDARRTKRSELIEAASKSTAAKNATVPTTATAVTPTTTTVTTVTAATTGMESETDPTYPAGPDLEWK